MRPLVIVTEPLPDEPLLWLRERARVVHAAPGDPDFESAIGSASALVVRTYTRVDRSLLDRAPRLKAVARAGVGLDNIDLPACKARGIAVLNTPDANTSAVAEFVFARMLEQVRPALPVPVNPADWQQARIRATIPRELNEQTLGIIGLGRIGSRVARIAAAFEMRVVYTDLLELDAPPGCTQMDQTAVLTEADILTIHVDGRPENRNLIGQDQLARLKPGVLLINTSRGLVIDEPALATFLTANPGARALLDVHATEPVDANNPLLPLPNATLTPHIAAATTAARTRMGWVVSDLLAHLSSQCH